MCVLLSFYDCDFFDKIKKKRELYIMFIWHLYATFATLC